MLFEFKAEFVQNRDDYFERICANKKVLHIGACDAPYTLKKHEQGLLLHEKLNRVCSEIIGVDIDDKAICIMEGLGYKDIVRFDMNRINELDFVPDVIVFGETIEHLMNTEVALTNIKKIMSENCKLLISTPNAFYLNNFFHALKNQENAHEDHKHYFTPQTLKQLLEANRLHAEKVIFTFLNRESESFKNKMVKRLTRHFPMLAETLVFQCKLQ
ncbi:MAG: hypothetical protein CEE38_13235 [Planctomycetes bacterium B3_Pla]|nr:MAG: hypothetical protein CEE38_13235 [Planctomycetes bacterium B3_Pla]